MNPNTKTDYSNPSELHKRLLDVRLKMFDYKAKNNVFNEDYKSLIKEADELLAVIFSRGYPKN